MSYWNDDNHDLDYQLDKYAQYYPGRYNWFEEEDQFDDGEIMEQFEAMLYMLDVKPEDSDFYVPALDYYQDIVDTYNALGHYWYCNHRDYEREYPDGRTPEEYIDDLYGVAQEFKSYLDGVINSAPELSKDFNFQHIRDIANELANQIAQKILLR